MPGCASWAGNTGLRADVGAADGRQVRRALRQQVNMAWLWARIKARTTRLGTFKGGFQAFADRFAARLREMGVTIRLSTPVTRITARRRAAEPGHRPPARESFDQCLVDHLAGAAGAPGARSAARLPARAARAEEHGGGGDGAGAQAPALRAGVLLVQPAQIGRLPLPGAGRAHQFPLAGVLRRRSHRLHAGITWSPITSISA